MTDQGGLLVVRTDHDPRAVHQAEHRDVEGVAELQEAGALVRAVGIDRAGQVMRVVRDHSHRPPLDPDEGGDHADPELRPYLQHRADVGQPVNDLLHVVEAKPVLGNHVAQRPLVVGLPTGDRPLEVGEVLLRCLDRRFLVLDQDVDHAVRHLEGHRADFLRRIDAQAAALDHRRAAHRDGRRLGGDDHVATGEQSGVAREAAAVVHADQGNEPRELGELGESVGVEGDPRPRVVVAGPAAAALGEEHERQTEAIRQVEQAVLLVVVAAALGAGEYGVVVGEDHRPGVLVVEEVAVDRRGAGHHAVGGRVLAQLLVAVLLVLPRHDQRPVLLERPGVDELLDVLPGRLKAEPPAPGDGLRPVLVQGVGVAANVLFEVGPDVVGVDLLDGVGGLASLGRLDEDQGIALADRVADGHRDLAHRSARVGAEHVLHLHRLDHRDLLSAQDLVALLDIDADDRALDRCCDADRSFESGRGCRRLADGIRLIRLGGLGFLVVREQGERIDRVDARAGEAAVAGFVARRITGARRRAGSARGRNETLLSAVARGRGQFPRVVVEPARVEPAGGKVGVAEDALQPRDVRVRAADPELVERPRGSFHGAREVARG